VRPIILRSAGLLNPPFCFSGIGSGSSSSGVLVVSDDGGGGGGGWLLLLLIIRFVV